jgi:gamma-glutamylcyclotransferase (GGCT)/AIG2-like uncharacterized protein YtfP
MLIVRYFAYGSNMASEVIVRACPRHRFSGVARLDRHRLAFTRRSIRTGTGVADVVPAENESVFGVLYEVDEQELAALDRKEGYGWAYIRITRPVVVEAGGPDQIAAIYTVRVKELAEVRPSRQYLDRLIAAGCERRLPEEYIDKLETMITCQ